MKRILVIGGSGLIGYRLVNVLSDMFDLSYTYLTQSIGIRNLKNFSLDVTDVAKTNEIIENANPDIVIHTAAVKSVDACEKDKAFAHKVLVEGTRNVVEACKKINANIVYISTAFVFGNGKEKYTEEDTPNPINYYGKCKLDGEISIQNSSLDYLIVRTDQAYGWCLPLQKKNFVVTTLEKTRNNEVAEVCSDWYNNPTFVDDLTEAIKTLLLKNSTGVYHAVGDSYVNRYQWALEIAKVFDFDKNLIKGINSGTLNLPAKRPNCNIDNSKIKSDLGIKLSTIEEGLETMKKQKEL